MSDLATVLTTDLGVGVEYRHIAKRVVPGETLNAAGAVLKWYDISPEDAAAPAEIAHLARDYVAGKFEGRGLGFVILHRCGRDFYFLLVSTWRGNNEVWETVFYKDGDAMSDFAVFRREEMHKPTFCVWELAAVWHEKEAWERFLLSARDEAAAETWLRDVYAGVA